MMAWYYAHSEDAEFWHGALTTREAAIEAACVDQPGDPVWIAHGEPMKHQLPAFEDWFAEAFDDANCDVSGEDSPSESWPADVYAELITKLEAVAKVWMTDHGYDKAWALDLRDHEQVPA
jgi:hypothetical protein